MEEGRGKQILGVIGGMGPEATSYFYENVIAHTKAQRDQDHLNMVILSHADIPDRGAANIAITCNTSHYYYDQIQKAVSVPIINMIHESVAYAVRELPEVKRIGIMGTDGTIGSRIYHRECRKLGVTPVKPSPERQKDVMSLIYDDIKSGKRGDRAKFDRVMSEFMRKNCDAVILACTELSVFKGKHEIPTICLDAMDVLVREAILRSGAEYQ